MGRVGLLGRDKSSTASDQAHPGTGAVFTQHPGIEKFYLGEAAVGRSYNARRLRTMRIIAEMFEWQVVGSSERRGIMVKGRIAEASDIRLDDDRLGSAAHLSRSDIALLTTH